MSILDNTYFVIYILGCIASFLLIVFGTFYFWFLKWITKGNIILKNLKKISFPEEETLREKILIFIVSSFFGVLLSWINVIFLCWQILRETFLVLRELLLPVPEQIKLLIYPLRNNPQMERELVWAYAIALRIKRGEIAIESDNILLASLQEMCDYYPNFSRRLALNKLIELNVIKNEILSKAVCCVELLDKIDGINELNDEE